LNVIAQAHKLGGKATYIDAEHALDPIWVCVHSTCVHSNSVVVSDLYCTCEQARKIGVKIDELLVCQPDSGEQALEIADTLVQGTTCAPPSARTRSLNATI
jgi:recombination protein RecA